MLFTLSPFSFTLHRIFMPVIPGGTEVDLPVVEVGGIVVDLQADTCDVVGEFFLNIRKVFLPCTLKPDSLIWKIFKMF